VLLSVAGLALIGRRGLRTAEDSPLMRSNG
jgi:hypothetical protein